MMVELMRTPARQAREEREMVRLMPEQMKERVRGDGTIFSLDCPLAHTFTFYLSMSQANFKDDIVLKCVAESFSCFETSFSYHANTALWKYEIREAFL